MKKGMIWRVRDGAKLSIWADPWIPRGFTRKPSTPRSQSLLSEVAELIDPYKGNWDEALVRNTFREEDAEVILAILVHQGRDNLLAWHFDKHGVFSVRSAYKVGREDCLQRRSSNGQQGSSVAERNGMWKDIWRLMCPNKIKPFFWRFAHNSPALRCDLVHRDMDISIRCPVCDHVGEDGGHLFFKCCLA